MEFNINKLLTIKDCLSKDNELKDFEFIDGT